MGSEPDASTKCGRWGTMSTMGSLYKGVQTRPLGTARGGWAMAAASSSPVSTRCVKSLESPASRRTSSRGCCCLMVHRASENPPISADTSAPMTTVPCRPGSSAAAGKAS
ncbi:hypothetical protein D3C72_2129000 [compost metagenome]